MIEIKTDSAENEYIDAGNVRVTFLKKSSWEKSGHGLRIQAYRSGDNNALHQGAELHLSELADAYELISAISLLVYKYKSE